LKFKQNIWENEKFNGSNELLKSLDSVSKKLVTNLAEDTTGQILQFQNTRTRKLGFKPIFE